MTQLRFFLVIVLLTITQLVFPQRNSLTNYKPGFYIGVGMGYAKTNEGRGLEESIDLLPGNKDVIKGKFGGRIFAGYSFLPYLGLEAGYSFFPSNQYKITATDFKTEIRNVRDIDLMVEGILPLEHLSPQFIGWHLFSKLGAAFSAAKNNINNSSRWFVCPAISFGVGYNFTDHFSVDLSWLGIFSYDKISLDDVRNNKIDKVPNTNLVALSVSYKF